MSSEVLSSLVDVNSRSVLVEIGIDGESSFDWSVGHDLSLDGSDVSSNGVSALSLEQGLVVSNSSVLGDALLRTGWGGNLSRWAVKSARWDEVWLAPFVVSVSVSSNDSSVDPISPGLDGVSSSTSVSTGSTASEDVLHRVSVVGGLSRGNTDSISDGFSSSEGPTRSTVSLISDFVNGSALWPIGLRIEAGWDGVRNSGDDWDGVLWGSQLLLSEFQGSVHSSDGFEIELGPSLVVLGLPGRGWVSIDLFSDFSKVLLESLDGWLESGLHDGLLFNSRHHE